MGVLLESANSVDSENRTDTCTALDVLNASGIGLLPDSANRIDNGNKDDAEIP